MKYVPAHAGVYLSGCWSEQTWRTPVLWTAPPPHSELGHLPTNLSGSGCTPRALYAIGFVTGNRINIGRCACWMRTAWMTLLSPLNVSICNILRKKTMKSGIIQSLKCQVHVFSCGCEFINMRRSAFFLRFQILQSPRLLPFRSFFIISSSFFSWSSCHSNLTVSLLAPPFQTRSL